MANLNNDQQIIMNIVSKYGCMSMQQVYDLFPNRSHRELQIMVTQMLKGKYLERIENMYLINYAGKDKFKTKTIDYLWAIIRLTHGNLEEIQDTLRAVSPYEYMLTVKNIRTYKLLMPTVGKLGIVNEVLSQAVEKAKKAPKKKYELESFTVFVCTSKEVLAAIKEYDFPTQVNIVYLDYETTPLKPTITCWQKKASTAKNAS